MMANTRSIFSVFYYRTGTIFYRIIHNTVFLLLTITIIFYSHSGFSESRSENTNIVLEKQTAKEIQRIKDKLKDTKKNMAAQKEKKVALEAQLQELENQVQQLLKQNAEKDSKLKSIKQQKPAQSD